MEQLLDALVQILHAAAAEKGPDGAALSVSQSAVASLVAGALVRLARNRGLREVPDLTNEFLLHAYSNEHARVVRAWPTTLQDATSPNTFFTTALWLRQRLIACGIARPVDAWPSAFLPTMLDSYPAHAVYDDSGWLYATLEWRALFNVGRTALVEGDFDLRHAAASRGVEVLELPTPCVDEDGAEYGRMLIAGRRLVAPLVLEQYHVSMSAWKGLILAGASA